MNFPLKTFREGKIWKETMKLRNFSKNFFLCFIRKLKKIAKSEMHKNSSVF